MNIRARFVIVTLLSCCPAFAQKEPDKKEPDKKESDKAAKPDPAVKTKLDEYKKILKAKDNREGARDGEAIKIIDGLLTDIDKLHPKDKKDFAAALGQTVKLAKRPATAPGIYNTVVLALGKAGADGSRELRGIYGYKPFTSGGKSKADWFPLRAKVLEQVGKTKDEGAIKFLLDEALKNAEHDSLMATAGQALGNFDGADQKVRKEIAKELIKKLNEVYNNGQSLDPGDATAKTFQDRFKSISSPWNQTLVKLTRQKLSKPQEWQEFWNKSGRKDWDKLGS